MLQAIEREVVRETASYMPVGTHHSRRSRSAEPFRRDANHEQPPMNPHRLARIDGDPPARCRRITADRDRNVGAGTFFVGGERAPREPDAERVKEVADVDEDATRAAVRSSTPAMAKVCAASAANRSVCARRST